MSIPQAVDLFAGAGGMSEGLTAAGIHILQGFDNWQPAIDTYNANHAHGATMLDLGDLDATLDALRPYFENASPMIVGGPPCQDFSSAGKRNEGARANLTETFASVVAELRPPVMVMENVARAASSDAFGRAVATLEHAGYEVRWAVLDASRCGVPQARKRLFTIASKTPDVAERVIERATMLQAPKPMTVRDLFGDGLGIDAYYRHPRSYARRAVFSIDEPSPTIRGVNRPIPPGYTPHPGDAAPIETVRPLTTRERASIQTFPDTYKFHGSRTDIEQMIGNAVPVHLARHIGAAVFSVLETR